MTQGSLRKLVTTAIVSITPEPRHGDLADQASFEVHEVEVSLLAKRLFHQQERDVLNDQVAMSHLLAKGRNCTDCGEMIPKERLRAKPFANRCTQCQEMITKES